MHDWLLNRWYGARPSIWLVPLTALFIPLAALRRWAYRRGLWRTIRLPVPVIVVGNITVGGTGKTPFVIWLGSALRAQGHRPGIVTRGYRGVAGRWPVAVTSDSDPVQVGDEAVLLARRTGLPVAAGPDRVAAARLLLRAGVNVILSDDGLQHYRLGRDVEIIMLDGARGLGNRWRLPAGPLREPVCRLARAGLVIVKAPVTAPESMPAGALPMHLKVEALVNLENGRSVAVESFAGQQVHAVAGIGNPQQFFTLLRAHGLEVDAHALPDHVQMSRRDFDFEDDRPVLMTEKDAIKCRATDLRKCWYLKVAADFADQDGARILSCVSRLPASTSPPVVPA